MEQGRGMADWIICYQHLKCKEEERREESKQPYLDSGEVQVKHSNPQLLLWGNLIFLYSTPRETLTLWLLQTPL